MDPQDKVAFDAISNLSYNEVVERLVHLSTARDDKSFDQSDPAIQQGKINFPILAKLFFHS